MEEPPQGLAVVMMIAIAAMPTDGDGDVVAAAVIAVVGIGVDDLGLRGVVVGSVVATIIVVMVAVAMMMVMIVSARRGSECQTGQADRTEEKQFRDIHNVPFQSYL